MGILRTKSERKGDLARELSYVNRITSQWVLASSLTDTVTSEVSKHLPAKSGGAVTEDV